MSHSYCNLLYHIVYSTKYRQPWLTPDISDRVHQYLGGITRQEKCIPLIINGGIEHVHLLAKLHQNVAVSDFLRILKSKSSAWIHRTFPNHRDFAWQGRYAAFTVGRSQVEKTRLYILNQEEHHRHVTFEEEFIALLDAHGVEYDRRYLWE